MSEFGGTPLHLEIFGLHFGLGTFPGGTSGLLLGIAACLAIGTLAASTDQRASALTFLRRGRELLRAP